MSEETNGRQSRPVECLVGHRAGSPAFWWAVHNLFAHPASELLYWVGLGRIGDWLHEQTIPIHNPKSEGRG